MTQPVSPMAVMNTPRVQAVLTSNEHSAQGKASMVAHTLIKSYPDLFAGQSEAAIARASEALTGLVRANPGMVDAIAADMPSFCDAVLTAIGLGLSFQPTLGHCYLIPRACRIPGKNEWGTKVCFQLGYRGLLELARRSGHVLSAQAELVYPGDLVAPFAFSVTLGSDRKLVHLPDIFGEGRVYANAIGAYATATLRGGVVDFDVLSKAEIERARAVSKSTKGPWIDWPEEMAKKTALRRLLKRLGLSIEAAELVERDDRDNEIGEPIPMPRATPRPPGPSMLAAETAHEVAQPFEVDADDRPMPADVASAATWAAYDTARGVDPTDRQKQNPARVRNAAAKLRDFLQKFRGADGQPLRRRELHDAVQRAADKVATVDEMVKRLGVKEWGDLGDEALLGFGAALVRVRAEGEVK